MSLAAPVTPVNDRRHMLLALGLIANDDVASMLGVLPFTLYTWRKDKRGPNFTKLGRDIYYRVEDLRAWIGSNVVELMAAKELANDNLVSAHA